MTELPVRMQNLNNHAIFTLEADYSCRLFPALGFENTEQFLDGKNAPAAEIDFSLFEADNISAGDKCASLYQSK